MNDSDSFPLQDEPTRKRKVEALQRLNYTFPTQDAVNLLIASFASKKQGFRWLDVECKSLPLELISLLKPSLVVLVDHDTPNLIRHNFRYTVSKLNAPLPDIRFKEHDLAKPKQLLQLLTSQSTVLRNPCKAQRFDLITSVFSLSRFFASEESAKQLFSNLSSYLEDDGRLICIFRSGSDLLPPTPISNKKARLTTKSFYDEADEIAYRQERSESTEQILQGLLNTLEQKKTKKVTYGKFGSLLPQEQDHTIQAHQQAEYLVFRNVVLAVAESVGFTPINVYSDELMAHYEEKDAKQSCKHFKDTCYVSVVFQKKDLSK